MRVDELLMTILLTADGHVKGYYAAFNFLFAIGMLLVSAFLQVLATPKAEPPERAGMKSFDFPQVEEGTPQCVIFGDVWIEDWTVLYYGNLRSSAIKSDGGKK